MSEMNVVDKGNFARFDFKISLRGISYVATGCMEETDLNYRKICSIRHTLVGYKIVYHSDVVGASPAGAAPTTSSFLTEQLASKDCAKTPTRRDEKHLSCFFFVLC